jgi:hypothetical protein
MKNFVFGALGFSFGFSFLLAGCGSDSGSSAQGGFEKKAGPFVGGNPKPEKPAGGDADANGNPDGTEPELWASDIDDSTVKPCPAGKAFANGKCFDEVHIGARITLKNLGEEFVFAEAGKPLSPFILKHYTFSEEKGDTFVLINERLNRLANENGFFVPHHIFLPLEIEVSNTGNPKDLSKAVFLGAEFDLSFSFGMEGKKDSMGFPESAFLKGSVDACGKTLPLPLTQKVIESQCSVAVGTADVFYTTSPFGKADLDLEVLETTLDARRVYSIRLAPASRFD